MKIASALSAVLALTVVPLIFDLHGADPIFACKCAVWLLAAALVAAQFNFRLLTQPAALCFSLFLLWAWLVGWGHGLATAWTWLLPMSIGWVWLISSGPGHPWTDRAMLWGWGVTSGYSWLQRLGLDPWNWSHPQLSRDRTIAGLGNPNYLSMYLAALMPLAWSRCYRWGLPGCLGWLVAWIGLLLTGSRGSALVVTGLACLTFIHCLVNRSYRKEAGLAVGLVLLGWPLAWSLAQGPLAHPTSLVRQFSDRTEGSSGRLSADTRLTLWRVAARLGGEHALSGVGPGRFGEAYLRVRPLEPVILRPFQRMPEDPHNEALRVWAELGVPGFLLWLCWLAFTSLALWRRSRLDLLGLAALILNSITNSWMLAVWPLLMVWTYRALEPAPPKPRTLPLVAAGLVVLGVLVSVPIIVVQRCFWWDDEYRLAGPAGHPVLAARRWSALDWAERLAPPWNRAEVYRRQADFFLEQAQGIGGAQMALRGLQLAEQRLNENPANAYAWVGLAGARQVAGDWVGAEAAWAASHQRDPRNPLFLLRWAQCLAHLGKTAEALQLSQQSLEIYSNNLEVYRFRAQIMIEQGKSWEGYWGWVQGLESQDV